MNEFHYMQCPQCGGTGTREGQKFGCSLCVGRGVLKSKGPRPKWRFIGGHGVTSLYAVPVDYKAYCYFYFMPHDFKTIIYAKIDTPINMHRHAIDILKYKQRSRI